MADLFAGQGTFTDKVVHDWLESIREGCWASLHFDSPAVAGELASEFSVVSGGYRRIKVEFTKPNNRVMWNSNSLRWRGLAANRLLYVGGWDRANGGEMQWFERLPQPVRIREGEGWSLAEEEIALSLA